MNPNEMTINLTFAEDETTGKMKLTAIQPLQTEWITTDGSIAGNSAEVNIINKKIIIKDSFKIEINKQDNILHTNILKPGATFKIKEQGSIGVGVYIVTNARWYSNIYWNCTSSSRKCSL